MNEGLKKWIYNNLLTLLGLVFACGVAYTELNEVVENQQQIKSEIRALKMSQDEVRTNVTILKTQQEATDKNIQRLVDYVIEHED